MNLDELTHAMIPDGHPVLPGLWVGNVDAGRRARLLPEFDVLNVREGYLQDLGGIRVAIDDGQLLTAGLDEAAAWVDDHWHPELGRHVLVHCLAGADRSPMVIVWFLRKRFNLSMDDAYYWVKVHRPVNDRRDWLDEPARAL